jgi:hypothetical protein
VWALEQENAHKTLRKWTAIDPAAEERALTPQGEVEVRERERRHLTGCEDGLAHPADTSRSNLAAVFAVRAHTYAAMLEVLPSLLRHVFITRITPGAAPRTLRHGARPEPHGTRWSR